MAKDRKDPGARKHFRIDLHKPGFLIPAPDEGVCLDVGALSVPKVFGLAFTSGGEVLRVCSLTWRKGELVGARFVTAKELRAGFAATDEADPKLANATAR